VLRPDRASTEVAPSWRPYDEHLNELREEGLDRMRGHRKWSELRDKMMERPGAPEAVERARAEYEEEVRL
jgi:hypothetical protein